MPLRLVVAYALMALLVLGAAAMVLRVRRARKERDKTRRYLR
jgi:hypothetical protein